MKEAMDRSSALTSELVENSTGGFQGNKRKCLACLKRPTDVSITVFFRYFLLNSSLTSAPAALITALQSLVDDEQTTRTSDYRQTKKLFNFFLWFLYFI